MGIMHFFKKIWKTCLSTNMVKGESVFLPQRGELMEQKPRIGVHNIGP